MVSKKSFVLLVLTGLTVLYCACRKPGASWDTDLSSPLFNTSFGIDNLIADSLLVKNTDSSLTLVYNQTLINYTLDSLVHIPDTSVINSYHLPLGSFVFKPGDVITPSAPNNATQTTYPLHGIGLKTATLRTGVMHVEIKNQIRKNILLNYQIPSANLGGVVFNKTVLVPKSTPAGAGVYKADYDLSAYVIDMSGPNHNTINTVTTVINATIDPSLPITDTVLVQSTESLVINSSFQKLVPEYAKGYFGQTMQKLGPTESIFSIFSKVSAGSIQLQNVTLNFHIDNNVGLDAQMVLADVYSKNTMSGNTVHLTGPIVNNPININRATETYSWPPAMPSHYSSTLNSGNSNIKALIENLPHKLGFQLNLLPNPMGNVSGYNDFVYYGYGLKAGLDLIIPLSVVANNLTLSDTVPVNFDKVNGQINKVHKCTLTLYASNGFPLDAVPQLFLLNEANVKTDSLIAFKALIDAAPVDGSLKAQGKRETILQIPVPDSKLTELLQAKKIMIVTRFNTRPQPSFLKIYSAYKIDFRLCGDFGYLVKLN